MSKLYDNLNEQMNFELESAYIYATMSAYLDSLNMKGMTHFFDEQVKEEMEHAGKIKKFLQDTGYGIKYRPLNPGDGKFDSIEDVFKKALAHEKTVTSRINDLVKQAREEGDQRVLNLLAWFVDEQIEEENMFGVLVERLERINGHWNGLYILDKELGER
ncbi:MAG TPA: ferritin [Hungateiclostridium thermocellum]|uniref:Ferritin n=2 Tax=Acetivibrio thermocellus TaxID=1515 RepID=A3DBC9_ACET2|nr:ferritin [Acetivibrio thermocellus]CDG34695.1 Ferritin and Dps [Acetivibrio thermocellus BC1]ABN51258.1 Ferritin Dps family protein [Acetivibrio thermocellus ATCC 27405]ADU75252.1 Ferritin Dps family protein [Acetivibrio thermocellus DSM 1313]ALX09234.1 Ferritin Dps family protein [Acetivibrio thermocellus AD2]ANV76986.1 Ferritin Dps family protein [Acetivibrio thermocellus DSM 2360]